MTQSAAKSRLKARRRAVAVSATFGVAMAFGLSPFATAPWAHADDLGLGDVIGELFGGTGSDLGGDGLAPLSADADAFSADEFFEQSIYVPIHTAIEGWRSEERRVGEERGGRSSWV